MYMPKRLLKLLAPLALLSAVACGQTPSATEEARGFFEGVPLFAALTAALVVVSVLIVGGALAIDRFVRTRQALTDEPADEEEDEDEEEVVAGIGVGRAPVPRWLYGAYVVIPLFALLYVVTNIAPEVTVAEPEETPAPTGPQTEVTVVASGILFEQEEIHLLANSEITVTFDNQDAGVPHDLVFWVDEAAARSADEDGRLAGTNIFSGVDQQSFTWQSGGPTELYFNCTVHPASMVGTAFVEEG
jgi:plastocyanin